MCLCIVRKCSCLRQRVKPSLAYFFWDGIPSATTNFINSKCCIQHTYYCWRKSQYHVMTIWDYIFSLSKIILHMCYTKFRITAMG